MNYPDQSNMEQAARKLLTGVVISMVVVLVVLVFHTLVPTTPAPAPVPHVTSDCRAACTLEGMELAGVELAAGDHQVTIGPRCLCAAVSR